MQVREIKNVIDLQARRFGVACQRLPSLFVAILRSRAGLAAATFLIVGCAILARYYVKYAHLVDLKLHSGTLESASLVYAAPRLVATGEPADTGELAAYLRRAGFIESTPKAQPKSGLSWYRRSAGSIEVHPGSAAYVQQGAVIQTGGGKILQIRSLDGRQNLNQFRLEPEVITNLFGQNREKQILVRYDQIPKMLVNAVLSAEDKRFFHHSGFDIEGILRAAWINIRARRLCQGASTITQQLARTLSLGQQRGWSRKVPEMFITLHLENVLSKRQIFEDYANTIYLGQAGSFSVHGFAEASRLYLGKDVTQLSLPDAALLAGLIQAPSSRNPFLHPERAKERRNAILRAMRKNGYIDAGTLATAERAPVRVNREEGDSSDAPYFIDLVSDRIDSQFQDHDFQSSGYRVYTTLDEELQKDAVGAVRSGIQETDQKWKHRDSKYGTAAFPAAQVALVALDAQTGEVKALVGGRSYGRAQFNHATALRQPGSSFKPFVYAAALNSALVAGADPVFTPASVVDDEPITISFNGQDYSPGDYEPEYDGPVTLRFALAHSLNIPAVEVAQAAGYGRIASLARAAGLGAHIQATPSLALGTYEVTPLQLAEAYTIFANRGTMLKTAFLREVRDPAGADVYTRGVARKQVLDPRVAYLVESMMEEVLRSGTGWTARARGFRLPAAGKTGTSHDGWFAGFTSKLICVVWVGFDDDRDLGIDGARSALPIWTEFMKRAHQLPQYSNPSAFAAPPGIVTAQIDSDTGELATANCPHVRTEVFIQGTEPAVACHLHGPTAQAGGTPAISALTP